MENRDYKSGKIIEIVKEWLGENKNKFEINGIDLRKVVFFYREKITKFEPIPKGNYRVVTENNSTYLIVDDEIVAKAYEYQICYETSLIASRYDEDFPELPVLVGKYNDIVKDVENIILNLKTTGIKADTKKMSQILAPLEPNTFWVADKDGVIQNMPIGNLNEKYNTMLEEVKTITLSVIESNKTEALTEINNTTDAKKNSLNQLKETLSQDLENISRRIKTEIATLTDLETNVTARLNQIATDSQATHQGMIDGFQSTLASGKSELTTLKDTLKVEIERVANAQKQVISNFDTTFNNDKAELNNIKENIKNEIIQAGETKKIEIGGITGATWQSLQGKPNFNSDVNSNAESEFATPKAVKTVYDLAVGKLDRVPTSRSFNAHVPGISYIKPTEKDFVTGAETPRPSILNFVSESPSWRTHLAFDHHGNLFIKAKHNDSGVVETDWAKFFTTKDYTVSDKIDLDSSTSLASSKAVKAVSEKINTMISALDICPYKAGDIYITTNTQNPALIWQGTTWQKIEGKFLKASVNGENAGATGGRDSVTLSVDNLPPHNFSGTTSTNGNHNHGQDSHAHSRGSMDITGTLEGTILGGIKNGAFYKGSRTLDIGGDSGWKSGYDGGEADIAEFQASRNWSGITTSAQPSIYYNGNHNHTFTTNSVGSGSAFDIKPSYMVVHIWKRIS